MAEHLLSELLETHAAPVIRSAVMYRLGATQPGDVDDVCGEALLAVLRRIQKARDAGTEIADFRSYVAVVAYHACDAHVRSRQPERFRLRNRVRYLVTHDPRFVATFEDDRRLLCAPSGLPSPRRPRSDVDELAARVLAVLPAGPMDLEELVTRMLDWQPVAVEVSERSEQDDRDVAADPTEGVDDRLVRRREVEQLWEEVQQLPVRQRVALLLNLRAPSGEEVASMIPLLGIASISELAGLLEIDEEQFATMWLRLPLDDLTIAAHLGITRQQVINLRKSARERLMRRLKGAA